MAGYKIVNIKELEDMAVKFGMSPNMEARFGRWFDDIFQKARPEAKRKVG